MNSVLEYIKYRWKAKGRHGIHSPFVYDLVDKSLVVPLSSEFVRKRNELFKSLQEDNREITVLDAGAGSKYFGSKRKVNKIFRISSSRGTNGKLLYKLCHHYQPRRVLELGTSLGVGTFHMAYANLGTEITTIEACSNTLKIAREIFEKYGLKNIEAINSTFDDFLYDYSGEKFDLIFIDGHHDGKALIHYLNKLDEFSHDETMFVLDDIRWSDSMLKAFQSLVGNSNYHVTIDLFRTGIILKRPQQEKEHFVI